MSVEKLALLCGRPDDGNRVAYRMRQTRKNIATKAASLEKTRVYIELDYSDPLRPYTAGKGSFIDELIHLAGGENIAGGLDKAWVPISAEAVIRADPAVLILLNQTNSVTNWNAEFTARRPAWKEMNAVKTGRIVTDLDANLLSRPRSRVGTRVEPPVRHSSPRTGPSMKLSFPTLMATLFGLLAVSLYVSIGLGSHEGGVLFDADWPLRWLSETGFRDRGHSTKPACPACRSGDARRLRPSRFRPTAANRQPQPSGRPFSAGHQRRSGFSRGGCCTPFRGFCPRSARGGWFLLPPFWGAQASVALVLRLARGTGGKRTILGLILAGVIVNAFCAALMTFLLTRFEPTKLRVTTLWLAGGVGYTEWDLLLFCRCGTGGHFSPCTTRSRLAERPWPWVKTARWPSASTRNGPCLTRPCKPAFWPGWR